MTRAATIVLMCTLALLAASCVAPSVSNVSIQRLGLAWSQDGQSVMTGSSTGRLEKYDLTGGLVQSWPLPDSYEGLLWPTGDDSTILMNSRDATRGYLGGLGRYNYRN